MNGSLRKFLYILAKRSSFWMLVWILAWCGVVLAQEQRSQVPGEVYHGLQDNIDSNLEGKQDFADGFNNQNKRRRTKKTSGNSTKRELSFWVSPDGLPPLSAREAKRLFPVYPIVEKQQQFWIAIFSKHSSKQGLLHDGLIGLPVYEEVNLQGLNKRAARRIVRVKKSKVSKSLIALTQAIEQGQPLDASQRRLRALFPQQVTSEELRKSAANVRFQRGLSDRFRQGLERSSSVLIHARKSMKKHGVPLDVAFLPHVESSFHNHTYSNKGAAGMWQFTRGTARHYMTVSYEVDERLDPVMASDAAARFLRQNYDRLGTWPLAITAYNHGPLSLERIVAQLGTRNLGVLIENYHGGLFKIASKNFYAEFLAARAIALQPEDYFQDLQIQPTLAFQEQKLSFYLDATLAAKFLKISTAELRKLNPALRYPIWSNSRFIPPGYALRLPVDVNAANFLASIPSDQRFSKQRRTWVVRVRRGDTLYSIGRRHKVNWREIALANNIVSYRRLRPGQKLVIPYRGETPPPNVQKVQQEIRTANTKKQASQVTTAKQPVKKVTTTLSQGVIQEHWKLLRVLSYSSQTSEAKIRAVHGEVPGHYADWSGTGLSHIRRLNGISSRSKIHFGRSYRVPLKVSKQVFENRRIAYHAQQEAEFHRRFRIINKKNLIVKRGQSAWTITQPHQVPLWLFFRENPQLHEQVLKPGMKVVLPVLEPVGG